MSLTRCCWRSHRLCAGKIEVVKVNADDNPNLSLWFGVQHIPTLLHFEEGSLRGHLVGTASKDAILNLLSRDAEAGRGTSPRAKEKLYEQTIQQRRTTVTATTRRS